MSYGWVDEVADREEGMTRVREIRAAESRGRLAALKEVREMVKRKAEYFGKGFLKAQFYDEQEFWKHNQSCLLDLGDDIDAMIAREEGKG